MQVSLIADVHGNAVALDAVLAELEVVAPDGVVCLGDVASGPQPVEALERVRRLDGPVVAGNHDAGLLDSSTFQPHRPGVPEAVLRRVRDVNRWSAEQLDAEQLDHVRTFEPTVEVALDEGARLCGYHGSPRSYDDRVDATTPPDTLDGWFAGVDAAVFAGGHTHQPLVRRHGDALVLNPGSVGANVQDTRVAGLSSGPWAEYALVSLDDGRFRVDLRRAAFDVEAFLRATRSSGMPHADWLVERWQPAGGLLSNRREPSD